MKPVLIINFKTYEQGTGEKALKLARIASEVSKKTKESVILSVQMTDLNKISDSVKMHVYAQHIDPIEPGSHTGWILPQALKASGAAGTLINHSEHRIKLEEVKNEASSLNKNLMESESRTRLSKILAEIDEILIELGYGEIDLLHAEIYLNHPETRGELSPALLRLQTEISRLGSLLRDNALNHPQIRQSLVTIQEAIEMYLKEN